MQALSEVTNFTCNKSLGSSLDKNSNKKIQKETIKEKTREEISENLQAGKIDGNIDIETVHLLNYISFPHIYEGSKVSLFLFKVRFPF